MRRIALLPMLLLPVLLLPVLLLPVLLLLAACDAQASNSSAPPPAGSTTTTRPEQPTDTPTVLSSTMTMHVKVLGSPSPTSSRPKDRIGEAALRDRMQAYYTAYIHHDLNKVWLWTSRRCRAETTRAAMKRALTPTKTALPPIPVRIKVAVPGAGGFFVTYSAVGFEVDGQHWTANGLWDGSKDSHHGTGPHPPDQALFGGQ
jgi:hypothetical protein